MKYYKNSKGELFQSASTYFVKDGEWTRIPRSEYRALKREAKRIQDNTDWFEVAKQVEQITPQRESEFQKKFESDRFYFGESGMSGE